MYFDFNLVTDPPNDELVSDQDQLNHNWQDVADKINPFNQDPADFTGITLTQGTEALVENPSGRNRIAVWTGTKWVNSVNHEAVWTGWQTLGLRAPTVERPGYTPKARVDAISRRIVLQGGVLFNVAGDPWPTGSLIEITDDTSIQLALQPVNGGESVQQGATGQITAANGFASAVVYIDGKTGPDRTSINVRYQGDAGGGNFIMLDGIEWWY